MHESDPHSPQFDTKISPEIIADTTAFKLVESFPATINSDARAGRQFFQRLAMYQEWSGERNILTSFYLDAENNIQLGIFVRPLSEQPDLHNPVRANTTRRRRRRTFTPEKEQATRTLTSQPNLYIVNDDTSQSAEQATGEPLRDHSTTLGRIATTDVVTPEDKP